MLVELYSFVLPTLFCQLTLSRFQRRKKCFTGVRTLELATAASDGLCVRLPFFLPNQLSDQPCNGMAEHDF